MRGVKDFLRDSVPAMIDYILVVSTPTSDYTPTTGAASDRHDRLHVVNYLRQRASAMPVLDREAVPILPHLLDIPRHLAIITSAVIRNSRDFQARPMPRDTTEGPLDELCAKCFDVEEHALLRVSQLATKISSDRQQSPSATLTQILNTNSSPIPSSQSSLPGSSAERRRPRKSSRPSTAPSPSESNSSHRHMFNDIPASSGPRVFTLSSANPSVWPPSQERRRLHLRSTSTDSVPSYGIGAPLPPAHMTDTLADLEDTGKRVRGLFRGILRR